MVLVFVTAFVPATPEPLDIVFKEACNVSLPNGYIIVERNPSRGFATQGVTYSESGVIQVHLKDVAPIQEALQSNNEYRVEDGVYEKFLIGKKLGRCKLSALSGYVHYSYAKW